MIIRKSALVVILSVSAVTVAITLLVSNMLIQTQLQNLLTKQFKAKAEVNDVDLHPFGLDGSMGKVEVANKDKPMRNLFSTQNAEVAVDGWSLLSGNVVIDTVQVNQLVLDEPRKESGALPQKAKATTASDSTAQEDSGTSKQDGKKKEAEEKTDWQALKAKMPQIDFSQVAQQLNIPDLTKDTTFQSVERIKQAKTETRESLDSLNQKLKSNDIETRIGETRGKIEAIKKVNLKDLKSAEKALKDIKAIDKNIKAINRDYKAIKTESDNLIKTSKLQKNLVSTELAKDIQTVKQLAKIQNINTKDIAMILFGSSTLQNLQQVMHYINLAKEYMPESEPEPAQTTRRKGRDISFPVTRPFEPRLLVKSLGFDGSKGNRTFSGKLLNFSSNPLRYQKIVQMELKSKVEDNLWLVGMQIEPKKDHLAQQISFKADNIREQQFKLSDQDKASSPRNAKLLNSDIDVLLAVEQGRINGQINLKADQLDFIFAKKASSTFDKQIQAAFSTFKNVDVQTTISGKLSAPNINVKTNFDRKIANNLKKVVGKQIDKANKDLERYVSNKVAQELNLSNKELASAAKPIKQLLSGQSKDLNDLGQLRTSAEKQIQGQVNKHKNRIKKQAEDKLKKSIKGIKF
jgi:uncharacterized protein (TIGR03545 family)